MPRYVKPPGMPPEVEVIIDVVGNRVRQAIIRELATHGPATTAQLQGAVRADRTTTVRHLRGLEDAGIVSADTPPSGRGGRTPVWRLHSEVVEDYLEQLRAYLLGR